MQHYHFYWVSTGNLPDNHVDAVQEGTESVFFSYIGYAMLAGVKHSQYLFICL